MARLVVGAFITLDGVMQGPGTPDEDVEAGFEHGGWQVPYVDDDFAEVMDAFFQRASHLLLGRRTYDIFAAYWPHVPADRPERQMADMLTATPKYVASRTLDTAMWENTRVLTGEAAQAVAELKERLDGDIVTQGSSNLIRTLQRHDLVDEYVVLVNPVILGAGKRLFSEGAAPTAWRLVESRPTSVGVVYCRYERIGKPEYGTFAYDEE